MQLPVDPARFAAYLSITAVMVVTPGPANLFAVATGARRGPAAVVSGVAGMTVGNLLWYAAAGLGLGALAMALPLVFRVLAYLGAAYVAWLGLRALAAARRPDVAAAAAPAVAGRSAFRGGVIVQVSNPKALLYTTVVLPPFLDPGRPIPPQLLLFAAIGVGGDAVTQLGYGFGGAAIARRMEEPSFRRGFAAFTGLLLIAAAGLIALRG